MKNLDFREITNKNIWKICMLEVFEEQKDFVADNIQSLAEAYATKNEGKVNERPALISYEETPIVENAEVVETETTEVTE